MDQIVALIPLIPTRQFLSFFTGYVICTTTLYCMSRQNAKVLNDNNNIYIYIIFFFFFFFHFPFFSFIFLFFHFTCRYLGLPCGV